jgi:hypothetical protein
MADRAVLPGMARRSIRQVHRPYGSPFVCLQASVLHELLAAVLGIGRIGRKPQLNVDTSGGYLSSGILPPPP